MVIFFICFVFEMVSWSPDWPESCRVDQPGLEPTGILLLLSVGIKGVYHLPSFNYFNALLTS